MVTGTTDLSRAFARQLQKQAVELPQMPGTAAQIMDLSQREDCDAAKLSSVIHQDQTIASNVLRVANSAAYVGQVPCSSLQQAVSRLGMQMITEIAIAVSVRGRLFANPACAEMLATLWQHSVLTGFFTKEIARMRRRNVEIAFLCGLLHDVGKAVLLNKVDSLVGGERLGVSNEELHLAVHDQHVPAGMLLADQWKLPDQVAEAIVCHHDVAQAKCFKDLALTVRLADLLAHVTRPDPLGEAVTEEQLRQDDVLVELNLYRDEFDALLGMRERALQITEGMQ